jgi:tRNA (adenine22-N1)-methyltransferase
VRLGKRLKQIESMVTEGYDHIWDCCCDHGLLGAALLNRQAAKHIHFVDIVPALMQQLEARLLRFFPKQEQARTALATETQWQIHCMDVGTLPLHNFPGSHLVIIAGVGGDLMVEFIQQIHQRNLHTNQNRRIDFLLCPVHHQFALRQQLIAYDFRLLNEVLASENKRFYEILLVSTNAQAELPRISPTGNQLWQADTPEQTAITQAYLASTLAHYQRMQLNPEVNVQHIIDAYSAIKTQESGRTLEQSCPY